MPSPETFAKARDLFLKEAFPDQYKQMKASGQLQKHLDQIGQEADDLWSTLQAQMLNSPDLPEAFQDRVKALQAVPEMIREMVNADLIHAPL